MIDMKDPVAIKSMKFRIQVDVYRSAKMFFIQIGNSLSTNRENLYTDEQISAIFVTNQFINCHETNIKNYFHPFRMYIYRK